MPSPLASSGRLSPEKRYSSLPRRVTCHLPSPRRTTPSLPCTALPAWSLALREDTVSGGHSAAHPLDVHNMCFAVSPLSAYSVRPLASTATVLPSFGVG